MVILTFGFIIPQKKTTYIIKVETENKKDARGFFFVFRIDTIVVAKGNTQKGKTFQVSITNNKEFDIYCNYMDGTEFYVRTITPSYKDKVKLVMNFPKNYNNMANYVTCPKCNKNDQTIPIKYNGQFSKVFFEIIDSNGNTITLPYNNEVFNAGCRFSIYDPKFFCIRDKIKF